MYMVFFDDEMGICQPFGWDEDCEGALGLPDSPVVFPTRQAARKAITISTKFAQLQIAQGKPANVDFTEGKKHIKIRKLVMAESEAGDE